MKYFGEFYKGSKAFVDTPIYDTCAGCAELVLDEDSGVIIPYHGPMQLSEVAYHRECIIYSVFGDVIPPIGNSVRDTAKAVLKWMESENGAGTP